MHKYTFLLLLLLNVIVSKAQLFNDYDSNYMLATGNALVKNGRYLEALAYYDRVNHNDSNYIEAQEKKANALYLAQRYDDAIRASNLALHQSQGQNLNFYSVLANSFFRKQNLLKASEYFRKITEEYPYNNKAFLKLGMVEMQLNKNSATTQALQRNIELNFIEGQAHFLLGHLMTEQGRSVPASLALTTSILLTPDTTMAAQAWQTLAKLANLKYPMQLPAAINALEDEVIGNLELAFETKVVDDKRFRKIKPKNTLAKQLFLIGESLSNSNNVYNFWLRNYAELWKEIHKQELTRAFYYCLVGKVQPEKKVNKWLKRHKSDTAEVWGIFRKYAQYRQDHIFEQLNGTWGEYTLFQTQNLEIYAVGNNDALQKDTIIRNGFWRFITRTGKISYEGFYVHNQKDSVWKWYNPSGTINRTQVYDKGVKNDTLRIYYPDQQIKEKIPYKNNRVNGKYQRFYPYGTLMTEYTYKNGVIHGDYATYHPNGNKYFDYQYKAGEPNGLCFEYFDTGVKSSEKEFKDGKLDGPIIYFHKNGKKAINGKYKNGLPTGEWQWFYSNGELQLVAKFNDNGKKEGWVTEFYANGKVKEKMPYKNGTVTGAALGFFEDGQKLYEYNYDQGKLVGYKTFDLNGKMVTSGAIKNDSLLVEITFPDGTLQTRGEFVNGEKHGMWQQYYTNQKLHLITHYEFGKKHGEQKTYFADGKPKSVLFYSQGKPEGRFIRYFRNDTIQETGMYENGLKKGVWYGFFPNGILHYEEHFVKGKKHGYQRRYQPDGKLESLWQYDNGSVIASRFYDIVDNDVIERKDKVIDNLYTSFYPTGEKFMVVRLRNKQFHGPFTVYYPDGGIWKKGTMVYGQEHGEYEEFYPNQRKKIMGTYSFSNPTGKWMYFRMSGEQEREIIYEEDQIKIRAFHLTGKLRFSETYVQGELDGQRFQYASNGKSVCRKTFREGVLISYSSKGRNRRYRAAKPINYENNHLKTYFNNRKLALSEKYDDGYLDSTAVEYHPNGNKIRETNYAHGKKQGIERFYHVNGKLKSETNFFYSYKHGESTHYDNKERLVRRENYLMGKLHGERIFFRNETPERSELYRYGVLRKITIYE